jgi:large subunit ribosomal protein L13
MGKHKPIWDPSTDCGDYVVATGCHNLHTTGKKRYQKQYYTHNTRPGSLKQMSMHKMFEKWGGGEVLKKAVSGMLPKNRLRDKRLARLKGEMNLHCTVHLLTFGSIVFEGVAHPFKENLIRFEGKTYVGQHPEALKALEPKEAPVSTPASS